MKSIITNINLLRKPCELITDFGEVKDIIKELEATFETVKDKAWGLAANQIGIQKRVAIIRMGYDKEKKEYKNSVNLINPKILTKIDKIIVPEGCLSLPGLVINVDRYTQIEVENFGEKGEERNFWGIGQEGFAIQHEISHLYGRTLLEDKHKDINRRR